MTQQPITNISPAHIGRRIRVLGQGLEVTGDLLGIRADVESRNIGGDVETYDFRLEVGEQNLSLTGRETFEVVGSSRTTTARVQE